MKAHRIMIAAALVLSAPAFAQWLNYPTPGIPRLPNGKPNLEAPAPTAADGKPDLSGLYDIDSGRLFQDIAADIRPQDFPIQPWAAALARQREQDMRKGDPYSHCLPPVVPRINSGNRPFKILQLPGLVVILYETGYLFRQIFTDGWATRSGNGKETRLWLTQSVFRIRDGWTGTRVILKPTRCTSRNASGA
jgi:hypothetical protein